MLSRQTPDPGYSVLMKAVIEQNVDYVTAVLKSGSNLEGRDRLGQSVLYHAFPEIFTSKSIEIMTILVSHGINVNATLDADGSSALVTAVDRNLHEVVQLLVDNGADVNDGAASKFSGSLCSDPMYMKNNALSISTSTHFIFSKGCGHTVTPLLCAVMQQRKTICQILLKANALCECPSFGTFWRASVTSVCSNCDVYLTALHMAAYLGDLNMTYTLLNLKVDMTEHNFIENCRQSFNDITPLWFALLKGHESIVQLFLSLGKPVALACHFGSGLQVCLEEGFCNIALMILRAGYGLDDDFEWIQEQRFPTDSIEVIDKIKSLLTHPRPLIDCCCTSLRQRFGIHLNKYLAIVGAPKKVGDLLNFRDLTNCSWQQELEPDLYN
ncbi:unnamed protein product [Candidula unifasciata]|uniref:Uncharacterized protein n=1 Tax=Candidula unifasciata TaxID=100452 RepID=A0A8S3ZJV0_9EUPU|nr:unnamed protein product [Candidula unifasciata]